MSNYPEGVTSCDIPEAGRTDYSQRSEAEKRLDRIIANHHKRKTIEAFKAKGIKITIK